MDIWSVSNKDWTRIMLWRTSKNSFRVVQRGEYKPLLENADYILIDKKYAGILNQLSDQLTFQEVKIMDNNLKLEAENYLEINIQNTLDPDSIASKDSKGPKIWKYSHYYVFVSGDLKKELMKISEDEFQFSLGFGLLG